MRWVKWNSASRSSWIVTFSKPAAAENKRCSANKGICQSLHLNFAKALHSVGTETIFFTTWLCCEKGIWWFSVCLRYRGRHQEPAEDYHTWDSCVWSAPNIEPAVLFETENHGWHHWIWGEDRTTTGWVLAPKPPVQLGVLSPDLCGGPRLFSHTTASLAAAAAAAQASAALTPPASLTSGGGHFPPFFTHSGLSCPQEQLLYNLVLRHS